MNLLSLLLESFFILVYGVIEHLVFIILTDKTLQITFR